MTDKKIQKIISVLKGGLASVYLYQKETLMIPVFIVKEVNFVFLHSIKSFFVREKFIILTQDDINEGNDVFCLKLFHIRNHADLIYGDDILGAMKFALSDMRSTLELEIRNKRIQLREEYLSHDNGKDFLHHLLPGMQILREGALYLKYPDIKLPKDMKELLSLFDVAWSCNSQIFYYLIEDNVEENKIPSLIHDVHLYLSEVCTKINHYSL